MKKFTSFLLLTAFMVMPAIAFAAAPTNLQDLIGRAQGLVKLLVPLVMSLAVLAFVWGLFNFIFHGGDTKKRTEGYSFMFYGILALFVMVSMWGLVNLLYNTIFGSGVGGGSGTGSGGGGSLPPFI